MLSHVGDDDPGVFWYLEGEPTLLDLRKPLSAVLVDSLEEAILLLRTARARRHTTG